MPLISVLIQACSGIYPSSIQIPTLNFHESEFQKNSLDRIIKEFDKPETLALYMRENIPCVPDQTQYSQFPLETFLRGSGDCEDQAIFAAYSLRSMGYYAETLLVKWRGWSMTDNAHVAAFFFQEKDIYLLDNCLRPNLAGPFTSFEEVINFIQNQARRRVAWYRIYAWQEFLSTIP